MTTDLQRYIENIRKMISEIDHIIEEDKMFLDLHRRFVITDEAGEQHLQAGLQHLEELRKRYLLYLDKAAALESEGN